MREENFGKYIPWSKTNQGYGERKWDGFQQRRLEIPPQNGAETIRWSYGYQQIWNPQIKVWEETDIKITDPPQVGDSTIRRQFNFESILEYTWEDRDKKWLKKIYVVDKNN